jgi:hypothetical protein
MQTGKRKVAQVQVQPSIFSEGGAELAIRRFRPGFRPVGIHCNSRPDQLSSLVDL